MAQKLMDRARRNAEGLRDEISLDVYSIKGSARRFAEGTKELRVLQ